MYHHHQQQEQNNSLDTPTHCQQQEQEDDEIEIDPFYFEMNNAWSDNDDGNIEPANKRQKACTDDNDNNNVNHNNIQQEEEEQKNENKIVWEETQRELETVSNNNNNNNNNSGIELGPGDCIILSSSDSEILERAFNERKRRQSNQESKEEEDSGSDVSGIDLSKINGTISTPRQNRPKFSFEAESSVSSFSSFEFPNSSSVYTGRIRSFSNSTDSNEEIDIDNMYVEFEVASDTPDLNPIDDPQSSSSSSSDEMEDNLDGAGLNDSNNHMSDEDLFADEEETDDDCGSSGSQSDHRIINIDSDSELSGRDRFPCHQCGTMTYAISRYCLRCFKTRRNWLPQRPIPHKNKKKDKKGKNMKRRFTGALKYNQQKHDDSTDSDLDTTRKTQSNNNNNNINQDNSSMSRRTISSSPKKSPNKNLNVSSSSNTQDNTKNNNSLEFSPVPLGASSTSSAFVSNINNTTTATDSVNNKNNNTNESNDSSITHSQSSSTSQSSNSVPGSSLMTVSSSSSTSVMSEREQKLMKESMINSTPNSSSHENLSQKLKSVLNDNPIKVEPVEKARHPSSASTTLCNVQNDLCNVCNIRPKAAFVHNKVAHLYSCFKCSSHILKSQGRCPVCRRPTSRVVKIITV